MNAYPSKSAGPGKISLKGFWPGLLILLFLLSACAHARPEPELKVAKNGLTENPEKAADGAGQKAEDKPKPAENKPEPWGQVARPPAPVPEAPAIPGEAGFEEAKEETLADPIEPWNRAMYTFNDNLYMHVLKPATKAYNAVLPEGVRVAVRNFFNNIDTPVRFVNAVLQDNVKAAGVEAARFTINSTLGLAGFVDVARDKFKIEPQEKDLGLTLGRYGLGEGFYIVWPFLGPSTLRDSAGTAGDEFFLTPVSYVSPTIDAFAISSYQYFNEASLQLGEYEELRASAIEPYTALKNAYFQHRRSLIKKDP